jgi:hypothetical protein
MGRECDDESDGSESDGRGVCFDEIDPRDLREPLRNKPGLVFIDLAQVVSFDMKDPSVTDYIRVSGSFN